MAASGSGKTPASRPFFEALEQLEEKLGKNILVNDATVAGLRTMFPLSERGLLWHRDELHGLLTGMYGGNRGDIRTRLMETYDSGVWKYIRANKDPVIIRDTCLSLFGTIQPSVLSTTFSDYDRQSGFMTRFLFCWPRTRQNALWNTDYISDDVMKTLRDMLEYLLQMNPRYDGKPELIYPTPEAYRLYVDWYNMAMVQQVPVMGRNYVKGLISKLSDQVLRIAVILHYIECFSNKRESVMLNVDAMRRAIFLGEYFFSQHQDVLFATYSRLVEHQPEENIEILQAIVSLKGGIISDKLSTESIHGRVNTERPVTNQMSLKSVGRRLRTLGFKSYRQNGKRGIMINLAEVRQIEEGLEAIYDLTA